MSDTDTTAGTAVSAPEEETPAAAPAATEAPERDLTPEELVAAMESSFRDFKDGDIVEGDVVKIDRDEVLLDIGYKSEGVIPAKELSIRHDVKPAEVV
jgi:small subunit ribosomal protein S1